MSILDDIDVQMDKADEQAELALAWQAEAHELDKAVPYAYLYRWFGEHKTSWKCNAMTRAQFMELEQIEKGEPSDVFDPNPTELEKKFGKEHMIYSYGQPLYSMAYMSKEGGGFKMYTKLVQLETIQYAVKNSAPITPGSITAPMNVAVTQLRMPTTIVVKNITEWPEWMVTFEHGEAVLHSPFNNLNVHLILQDCWWPPDIPRPQTFTTADEENMYI